jgi:hypothetical protein
MASEAQIRANRENAKKGGRPVLTSNLYAQEFRERLAKRIRDDAERWYEAIDDVATGHRFQDENGNIYKKSPDPKAWSIAIERAFGKMKQEMDVTTNGKEIGEGNVNKEQIKELLHDVLKYPRPHTGGDKSGT